MNLSQLISNGRKSGSKPGQMVADTCPNPKCQMSGKFYFNTISNQFICFSCGIKGRFDKDVLELIEDKSFDSEALLGKLESDVVKSSFSTIDLDKVSIPLDFKSPFAYAYMKERGFLDEEIKKYKFRVGKPFINEIGKTDSRWEGRIIFPYFNKNEDCIYFTGRAYLRKSPKYLNTKGSKGNFIYNIQNVTGECIVCEGIISSIAAERTTGITSVALGGKSISENQVVMLYNRASVIHLCLDGGVTEEEKANITKEFIRFNLSFSVINLPEKKDPDELGLAFQHFFNTKVTANSNDEFKKGLICKLS